MLPDFWSQLMATLLGGLISAAIAFAIFLTEKRRDEKRAGQEAKRLIVNRMLDVVDQAIRAQKLPPMIRDWRSDNVALVLTLPRLMIDLPKEDLPVATWVATQIQQLAWEGSGARYLQLATNLSGKLVSWYRGDVKISWFEDELVRHPWQPNAKLPTQKRAVSLGRDMVKNMTYLVAGAAMFGLVKEGLLPLGSAFGRWATRNALK